MLHLQETRAPDESSRPDEHRAGKERPTAIGSLVFMAGFGNPHATFSYRSGGIPQSSRRRFWTSVNGDTRAWTWPWSDPACRGGFRPPVTCPPLRPMRHRSNPRRVWRRCGCSWILCDMAKEYDALTRMLLENHPADWLALFGLDAGHPVQVVNSDLSTLTAEADKVLLPRGAGAVDRPRRGPVGLPVRHSPAAVAV